MPQYDAFHETVKRALEKDGWTITADPFIIGLGQTRMYADLGAEKDIRLIIVEIKTFGGASFVNELHRATGQYSNYSFSEKENHGEHGGHGEEQELEERVTHWCACTEMSCSPRAPRVPRGSSGKYFS